MTRNVLWFLFGIWFMGFVVFDMLGEVSSGWDSPLSVSGHLAVLWHAAIWPAWIVLFILGIFAMGRYG